MVLMTMERKEGRVYYTAELNSVVEYEKGQTMAIQLVGILYSGQAPKLDGQQCHQTEKMGCYKDSKEFLRNTPLSLMKGL